MAQAAIDPRSTLMDELYLTVNFRKGEVSEDRIEAEAAANRALADRVLERVQNAGGYVFFRTDSDHRTSAAWLMRVKDARKARYSAEDLSLHVPRRPSRSYTRHAEGSLEHTIGRMLYQYPSLYQNRYQVLDQLYCTNGNGFEWEDGRLCHTFSDERRCEVDYDFQYKCHHTTASLVETLAQVGKMKEAERSLAELRTRLRRGVEPPRKVYPLCTYSLLESVPGNVRPDWLSGAYETLDLIDTFDPDYADVMGRTNAETMERARAVRARLDEQFGVRFKPRPIPEPEYPGTFVIAHSWAARGWLPEDLVEMRRTESRALRS